MARSEVVGCCFVATIVCPLVGTPAKSASFSHTHTHACNVMVVILSSWNSRNVRTPSNPSWTATTCPTRLALCATLTFRPTESLLFKGCLDFVQQHDGHFFADILVSELHTAETILDLAIDAFLEQIRSCIHRTFRCTSCTPIGHGITVFEDQIRLPQKRNFG